MDSSKIETENLELAGKILTDDPSYLRQLRVYADSHSTRTVTEDLKNQLLIEEQQYPDCA